MGKDSNVLRRTKRLREVYGITNYSALVALYWIMYDGKAFAKANFGELTSPETICRSYRIIAQKRKEQGHTY